MKSLLIYCNNIFLTIFSLFYSKTGDSNVDPGQVPNGAKCGENEMCLNSVCTSIDNLSKPCNCNGHGVCNQKGECVCYQGYSPPNCEEFTKPTNETEATTILTNETEHGVFFGRGSNENMLGLNLNLLLCKYTYYCL